MCQFWLERMTLYSLYFHFGFFTIDNQVQNFVKFWFSFLVDQDVVVQFDGNRFLVATINDSRELVCATQAAARTLTLLFT